MYLVSNQIPPPHYIEDYNGRSRKLFRFHWFSSRLTRAGNLLAFPVAIRCLVNEQELDDMRKSLVVLCSYVVLRTWYRNRHESATT